ncbi:galactose mutarotase-like protein [Cristinia sonorae]|uniref:Galactose mutarotase-like protein n=1 Tax=Cristinia sonorae TaxID=1940300 RepID=A0A8K0UHK1_9AGAR|nr:galactose mutarotase-like protein [Cristinia sonorae]
MSAPEQRFTPVLLTLPGLTPTLALEILPHGVTLHRLFVQADGRTHDLLIGPENPADHLTQKYTNTIVGRYANRLPVNQDAFPLSRNGHSSTFTPQSNESPTVSLHGGRVGFDYVEWTPLLDPSESQLFTDAEKSHLNGSDGVVGVIFKRISEDGEEGYPGRLLVETLVSLVEPSGPQAESVKTGSELKLGSVVIVYRAKLLDEGKVTPINLTQHWGFNLDASLKESLTVKEHTLSIKADHTIELNNVGLSTGSLLPVTGTHHAHAEKESKKIGEKWPTSGYDEFYVFSPRSTPTLPTRVPVSEFTPTSDLLKEIITSEASSKDPLVQLASEKSGLRVSFDSNQSGVQFYSNNLTNEKNGARKKIHGGSGVSGAGDSYGVGSAAFLEFHEPLAAWLNPSTIGHSGNDTLLASGEIYNNFVKMDVWFKSPVA